MPWSSRHRRLIYAKDEVTDNGPTVTYDDVPRGAGDPIPWPRDLSPKEVWVLRRNRALIHGAGPMPPEPATRLVEFDEEVVAARSWGLARKSGDILLTSPIVKSKTQWHPRKALEASCARAPGGLKSHDYPAPGCVCGIYGFTANVNASVLPGPMIGSAYFWDRLIIHTHGLRSARAYPRSLEGVVCAGCRAHRLISEAFAISGATDRLDPNSFTPLDIACVDCVPWARSSHMEIMPLALIVKDLKARYRLTHK